MKWESIIVTMVISGTLGTTGMANTEAPTTDMAASNLVLSVSLSNTTFHARDRVEITVTYSNRSATAVEIDEGSLRGTLADTEQQGMFMQAVRASLSRGGMTITLGAGEKYTDVLTLIPKK